MFSYQFALSLLAATLLSLIHASPISINPATLLKRAVDYPANAPRFPAEGWPPGLDDDNVKKDRIKATWTNVQELVSYAIDTTTVDPVIWNRWFDPKDHAAVNNALKNIVENNNGQVNPKPNVAEAEVLGIDVLNGIQGNDPCAEGDDAYTIQKKMPLGGSITYFCDKAYTIPMDLNGIACSDLGDRVSANMDFFGSTWLHELMHNDLIGSAAVGQHIIDVPLIDGPRGAAYGPYAAHQLRLNNPGGALLNADNYVYLTLELLWTALCTRQFQDPIN